MIPDLEDPEDGRDALRIKLEQMLRSGLAAKAGRDLLVLEPLARPPQPLERARQELATGGPVLAYFPEGCEASFEATSGQEKSQLDAALGTPEWRTAASLPKGIRRQYAVELYRNVLSRRSGASIRTYDVSRADARAEVALATPKEMTAVIKTIFWEMADGKMSILDTTGPGPAVPVLGLSDNRWLAHAGKLAHREFRGRTIPLCELRSFVVDRTPFPWQTEIVDYLQRNGKASVLNQHFAEMERTELQLRFSN